MRSEPLMLSGVFPLQEFIVAALFISSLKYNRTKSYSEIRMIMCGAKFEQQQN